MANVISIRIDADGKAAIVETRRTASEMSQELNRTGSSAQSLTSNMSKIAIPAAAIVSVYALGNAVQSVAGASIKYLSQMETSSLGIASSFMVGGSYIDETTGKVLEGSAALQMAQVDAAQTTERLQVANLQTIATLDQLIQAYQVTLPIAMAKGFDRRKVEDFTVAVVQAAGAIGVPMNQLGQELRALLTGDSWQDARIGQVLGLRPEDITNLKGDAEGLFTLLMDKLDAYKVAGVEAQKSWAGLASNAMDIALQAGGKAFLPLFEAVKYELTQITGELVTIDAQTNKIKWSPDFLDGIDSTQRGINSLIAEVYRFSMLIDKAGGSMTALGSRTLKTAEVITRFMTIGQFGDTFKKGSEEFARWNKLYEERYLAADKALQALADREAGLGKTSPSGSATYLQNPARPSSSSSGKGRTSGINSEYSLENDLLLKNIKKYQDLIEAQEKAFFELGQQIEQASDTEGRVFTLLNSQSGDLSTGDRYKVTNPSQYSLMDGKKRSIPQNYGPGTDSRYNEGLSNAMMLATLDAQGQSETAEQTRLLMELDERQKLIEEYHQQELISNIEKNQLLAAADKEYWARKTDFDKMTREQAIVSISQNIGQIGQILMQGNKDQFEAGKAFAIASAVVNTYMAASAAFSGITASTGGWGIAAAAVAAGAAIATGMAQVAAIESTQYRAGRYAGGPVEPGSTYLVGERGPERLTMGSQGGTVTPNSAIGGQSQQIRLTNVYQISTGVSDTVRAEIMRAVPAITNHSVRAVQQAINGGGELSRAVGRM